METPPRSRSPSGLQKVSRRPVASPQSNAWNSDASRDDAQELDKLRKMVVNLNNDKRQTTDALFAAQREIDEMRKAREETTAPSTNALESRLLRQNSVTGDSFDVRSLLDSMNSGATIDSATAVDAAVPALTMADASRADSTETLALVQADGGTLPAQDTEASIAPVESAIVDAWLDENDLATFCEVQRLLQTDNVESAVPVCRASFEGHVQDKLRPYLSFSMALSRFSATQVFSPSGEGTSDAMLATARERSRQWLRLLEDLRGEELPLQERPAATPRARFVRELCAQIGLSLDIARTVAKQSSDKHSSDKHSSGTHTGERSPTRARSRSRSRSKRQQIFRRALRQAGACLLAVKMDLERLHDAAEDGADPDPVPEPVAAVVSAPLALQDSMEQTSESLVPVEASDDVPTALIVPPVSAHEKEPKPPAFGDFVINQLLPLYVKDLGFKSLKRMVETHCGIPLDSDDEEHVHRMAGSIVNKRPQVRKVRRRQSTGSNIASSQETVMDSEQHAKSSLSEMAKAIGASSGIASLRGQMSTSVVQKKHENQSAPRMMSVKASLKPLARRKSALLSSPAPQSVRKVRPPASSPVAIRRDLWERLENTPFRTPGRVRGVSTPAWDLMQDTPR